MPTIIPGVGEAVSTATVYCTLVDLKAELGITDTADDDKLDAAIAAASRQIDGYCGRRFWADQTVQVRYFHAEDPACCPVDDISTSTGLIVATDEAGDGSYSTTLTVGTDFVLEPVNGPQMIPVWPYEELVVPAFTSAYFPTSTRRPGVKVTAKFGWSSIPSDVDKAACLQAAQLFKAKDAVFGVAAFGDVAALRVGSRINPMAATLLDAYRKPAIG